MRMPIRLPWQRAADRSPAADNHPEEMEAVAPFAAVLSSAEGAWSNRPYAALAREGCPVSCALSAVRRMR